MPLPIRTTRECLYVDDATRSLLLRLIDIAVMSYMSRSACMSAGHRRCARCPPPPRPGVTVRERVTTDPPPLLSRPVVSRRGVGDSGRASSPGW